MSTLSNLIVELPVEQFNYGNDEKIRGAIFTRMPVVDFMLDLIGYTSEKPLHEMHILEPSFGGGRFLFRASDRLIHSWRRSGGADPRDLLDSIRAVEIDPKTFDSVSTNLISHLQSHGISEEESSMLVSKWLVLGDYLGVSFGLRFEFVVGNPPYVRQELIDPDKLRHYRSAFRTMVGRADLYVAFIERSLDLLTDNGRLSFICADAWIKNEYGKALRRKIAQGFNFSHYVNMYGLEAFEISVGAYPSITVIQRSVQSLTRLVHAEAVESEYLRTLSGELTGDVIKPGVVHEAHVVRGELPWLVGDADKSRVIEYLERTFPTLVDAGCRVGIGVATGADKVFIAPMGGIDVEEDRILPLATNKCTSGGNLVWTGKAVINPYKDDGGLVSLLDYPKLSAYLAPFRAQLALRHTSKSNPERNWYKTIDRISPSLLAEPKLLIPDIKGNGDAITYDPGTLYPHHNLYFITSSLWNLRALQALLRSGIAQLFVEAYSVKIGGGYMRFQSQNLKRIRVPQWDDLSNDDRLSMIEAGEAGEKLSRHLIERIYKLEPGALLSLEKGS